MTGVTNLIPLWRFLWLSQTTNDATHLQARCLGSKWPAGVVRARYFYVLKRDSDYGMSFETRGLEKGLRTTNTSMLLSNGDERNSSRSQRLPLWRYQRGQLTAACAAC